MKNTKKYHLLRALMVVSMLMMALFSGYWLHTQYQDERALLKEDLETTFREAGDEVVDSLLMSVYIKPALNDSVNFTIDIRGATEERTKDRPPVREDFDHVVVKRDTQVDYAILENMIVERDSAIAGGPQKIQVYRAQSDSLPARDFLWKEEEMLVRSFKLVMSHTSGSQVTDSIQLINQDGTGLHASMLRGLFTSKVSDKNLNLRVDWVPADSVKNRDPGPDQLLVEGASLFPASPALVSGIFLYLIRETLPQIVFVLLFLGFSFTAFILMFRTMKKQYELNVLRQDMVSNMTHELKTPVSTMKVALEALDVFRAGNDAQSAKEYMGIATQEINRLDQLIARMLDLVTLEEKERIVKKEPVDLQKIAEDCVQMVRPRVEERNGTISVNTLTGHPAVWGESWYISAALTNLIDNSLKYSWDKPEISVEIAAVDTKIVQIRVHDNGPGIPKKYAKKVFEKFFRVPMGDIHNVKGHGLGLSFVAQVMNQHGGRAFQENRVPAGCSFILEFRQYNNGS